MRFWFLALLLLSVPTLSYATTPPFPADEFFVARITNIEAGRTEEILETLVQYQRITVEITSGSEKGTVITLEEVDRFSGPGAAAPAIGDRVTLRKTSNQRGADFYSIDDHYRLPTLTWIGILFIVLVSFLARHKGLGAVLGLAVSILALKFFIVPALISGANPVLVTLIGSFGIALVSMFLAHGFNRLTGIALTSTLMTLLIGTGLAALLVRVAKLSGLGSEGAFYLTASGGNFNFSGLLLGAIIIGMLGVLDDVTTAQTAAVSELKKANHHLSVKELYTRGLRIGREHIASLVNTLVLAYAGVGLPLFLLFTLTDTQPLWVILNSEPIAEEIIRTLAGSSALVLAVPIATWLAAHWLSRSKS